MCIRDRYYTDDATGTYRNSDGEDESYSYSIKDLKVGDSPQASISAGLTVAPVEDAQIQLLYNFYAFHYSDWSPTSRSFSAGDVPDRVGSWKTPTYGVLNLNARYKLPFIYNGITSELTLNVRNLLDEVYIQDATDNSRYNAYPFRNNNHKANAAEVYLGLPTAYNLGISFKF